MASFERNEVLKGRTADWALFQNGPVNMYWKPTVLEEDCQQLSQFGYRIHTLDCQPWNNCLDAFRAFSTELKFPDYFGENFSALRDCLSDLEVPEDAGTAIVLKRYDCFASKDQPAALQILDILARTSHDFLLFGERFVVLLQSNDPNLRFDPVGATEIGWNRREWLNKDRDL